MKSCANCGYKSKGFHYCYGCNLTKWEPIHLDVERGLE